MSKCSIDAHIKHRLFRSDGLNQSTEWVNEERFAIYLILILASRKVDGTQM